MTSAHRNITRDDFEYESYERFVENCVERHLGRDFVSEIDHSFPYIHDARYLYETGVFGGLLNVLDNQPSPAKWRHMQDADCLRCGAEGVGIIGISNTAETPDGGLVTIGQHSELCTDCVSKVLADLEETGEMQPTLTTGRWWEFENASAEDVPAN